MFRDLNTNRPVTVRIPSGSLIAYNPGSTFTNADTATNNWGNAFRGIGWDGINYLAGSVNSNIQLTFEEIP
jgi:hypothetical protein